MNKIVITLCTVAALSFQAAYAQSNELNPKNWKRLDNQSITFAQNGGIVTYWYKPSSLKTLNKAQQIKRGDFRADENVPSNSGKPICTGDVNNEKVSQNYCHEILNITFYCKEKTFIFNQLRFFDAEQQVIHQTAFDKKFLDKFGQRLKAANTEILATSSPDSRIARFYRAACGK